MIFGILYALGDEQRGGIEYFILNIWVCLKVEHAEEVIKGLAEPLGVL